MMKTRNVFKISQLGARYCYKKVHRPESYKLVSRLEYEPPSLAVHLADRIRAGGPISVADYMRAVLTHPTKGYYTQGDVFGRSGDFTTSPEISPLFGELVGVWFCHELSKIGSPRPLQLVELGPGRGTLAAYLMRVFKELPPGDEGISLHFVEVSERLAQIQAQRLEATELTTKPHDSSPHYLEAITSSGNKIYWYRNLKQVPRGFSIIVANEFFDALPIHKFQKIDGNWREILVSLKKPDGDPEFELVASRVANSPVAMLIDGNDKRQHVEVCPEAGEIVGELAQRLEESGGIGLIVDYGLRAAKSDTFRAFKSHQLHDPLVEPGTADLTADVDFEFLRRVVGERVIAYGPTSQREFLMRLGIEARLEKLSSLHPDQADTLKSGVKMLTEDMGERFQFMAMYPAVLEPILKRLPPAGFSEVT